MLNVFTASDFGSLFEQYLQENKNNSIHLFQTQPLIVPNMIIHQKV